MPEKTNQPDTPGALVAQVESHAQRFATPCADGELAWRRWGSGPEVVLLHGGTGSWTHWIRNVLVLARSHTVWIPDMPGFGDSAAPPKGSRIEALAEIVAAGIAKVAGGPVNLVGFSFGGLIAGHLAAAHPELVRRLVLVGAGGLGLRHHQKLPLLAWRHLKSDAERAAAHRHNLAILMLWNEAKIDALALHIQSQNAARSRINSGPYSRGDVLLEPLSRVKGPVAGIWGRYDSTTVGRLAEVEPLLKRANPGSTLTVIEDAGHWAIYEQAEATNAVLLQALAEPYVREGTLKPVAPP